MKNLLVTVFFLFVLCACTKSFDGGYEIPGLYKIDIQQGNVLEQDMINKLRPGMSMDKVKFIMGSPVIIDPFHNDRGEYIFSYQKGGGVREQRHITLHFDDDEKLSHITGDIEVSNDLSTQDDIITEEDAISVPTKEKKEKGFFERVWDKVTPGD